MVIKIYFTYYQTFFRENWIFRVGFKHNQSKKTVNFTIISPNFEAILRKTEFEFGDENLDFDPLYAIF